MTKQFSSVWTRPPRQPRSSGLGREQIVAAATELLDADGLEALSMRKLGAKLGAGATSLYWYVANKNELLELVMDGMWGRVRLPEDETSWREVAGTFAYRLRDTLLEHPWAAELLGRLPSLGPNSFRIGDRLRRAFVQAGFEGNDVYLATSTVMSYVLGTVLPEITYRKTLGAMEFDRDAMLATLEQVAADYPEMIADYRETVRSGDHDTMRALAFDFGLVCTLDGLAARVPAARNAATNT
ncbi:TetR/AcrR family transcriptional regulator C-terminal domain-containing protein [Nocardia terpenica]|uniref:TetR/AcrR family transcriptional regulator C-terminal domain-containing protein n=1 Tax=Nocardia terpenica TaxID=455432 RepID=UPI00189585EC|nr:TetR/AcrR family transcriptional regulator C-terminal domain-containing protein [Nocardia terpenica]MBF6059389.1 TetR/AcrR family transcriptional regulator C-terminal domain-containing protein [Nocardia terpenica]MBF6103072.1 TetR/AcrR family transcriptional regulator C-terminal domain-containing protein [Nocardia terpenica]MBF6110739.1 TetR/AcrR family transcriptional regulator C-terminal domain-containing protein [Nocardia terpenica]MBF6116870.1 TetR/AcrR family transcriptional regulator C